MAFFESIGHIAFATALFALVVTTTLLVRVGRLERLLELLTRGVDLTAKLNLSDTVKEMANDPTRKLEAIRAYREETGCGLAEAKDAVELYLASRKP